MTAVPVDAPLTTPAVGITVAIPVAPELHIPSEVASTKAVVPPAHTDSVPDAGTAGNGFTVTTVVLPQPVTGLV